MKLGKQLFAKKQRLKKTLIAGNKFITKYIEDILIFIGLTCIVIATFLLSKIAGMYVLGSALLGLGIYFTKCPLRKR